VGEDGGEERRNGDVEAYFGFLVVDEAWLCGVCDDLVLLKDLSSPTPSSPCRLGELLGL